MKFTTLAVVGTMVSMATAFVNPIDPWGETKWVPGSKVIITWDDKNPEGPALSTNPIVDVFLMTGSDQQMVRLATIAAKINANIRNVSYTVPTVAPIGKIYFIQFTTENNLNAWTTRFTITDAAGNPGTLAPTGLPGTNPGATGAIVSGGATTVPTAPGGASATSASVNPMATPTNGLNPPRDTRGGGGGGEGAGAGGDTKGVNGAAIGGGVAGGVVAIAAIAFLFVRRRRQSQHQNNNTKHPEYAPHHDQELPYSEDTDAGSSANGRFKWNQIQKTPSNPQGTPSSPHSTVPSPLASYPSTPSSSPFIPPLSSKPFQSTDRQKHVQSRDQHLLAIQEQIGPHKSSPQHYPITDQIQPPSTLRGPQGGGEAEPASRTSTQELRYQVQLMQAELKRRDAM